MHRVIIGGYVVYFILQFYLVRVWRRLRNCLRTMLFLSGILLVSALLCSLRVESHHCQHPFPCSSDSDTLVPFLLPSQKYSYEVLSQCADPTHCDDSTNGTGHQLYDSLSEDVVSIERCYSFCFSNVRNR